MIWSKQRFTKWTAGEFAITETVEEQGAFRLDAAGMGPQFFETLDKAKRQATVLCDLRLTKEENDRLRAELVRLRNPATALVEAVRQPATIPADDVWEADELDDADEEDDGRGIPPSPSQQAPPVEGDEVAGIAGRLLSVMARNGHAPHAFANT